MRLNRKKARTRLILEPDAGHLKWAIADTSLDPPKAVEIGVWELAEDESSPSHQKVVEHLGALARRYKFSATDIACLLPRHQVTVRHLELPSLDPDEIRKIMDLQAVKQTPYAADEIIFDTYLLHSHRREGYSGVMLVVAHRQVVSSLLRLLQSAGLKPSRISVSTVAESAWVLGRLGEEAASKVFAVLDADGPNADFFVVKDGQVIFTQNISTDALKLTAELSRALQIYRSEEIDRDPEFLVLCGGLEQPQALQEALQAATGLTVRSLPVFENEMRLLSSGIKDVFGKHSFSSVLGFAALTDAAPINLVPQETLVRDSLIEKSRKLLVTAVLVLSIFLSLVGIFAVRIYQKQSYLKWLVARENEGMEEARVVLGRRQRIKDVLNFDQEGRHLFGALTLIHRCLPREAYLTSLEISEDRRLSIQGKSDSMAGVFNFVDGLKRSELFNSVETRRMTKRIVQNQEIVEFEIDSRLPSPPEILGIKGRK